MTIDGRGVGNPLAALVELSEREKSARGLTHTPLEIAQQPATWESTFARVSSQKDALQRFLAEVLPGSRRGAAPTVYLIGAGTSDYVGRALTSILRQQWQCDVIAVPSTELVTNIENYVLPERPYLWISFSRSGDSSEGVGVLEMARRTCPQVHQLLVTCNKDGKMSEMCAGLANAYVLVLDDAVNDRGLAMTSSFTNMVVAGHCLANLENLAEYRPILDGLVAMGREMLANAAPVAEKISALRCRKACFVGSGALAAVATECALKALELTAGSIYTMAESTMGLRHGPMSALDNETLFVSFLSSDERRRRYEIDLLEEIHAKALGRVRVAVTPRASDDLKTLCDHLVVLEAPPDFPDDYRAPVDVIFGQLVGLFSSLEAGLQPDHPSPKGTINRVVSHVHIYP
jgi:tagatose-6-phosphate ketose/aldose isomerase